MFLDFFSEKVRPLSALYALAWRATVHPVVTGQAIVMGSRDDFNLRMTFFFGVAAVNVAIQSLVAAILGVPIMPAGVDGFWQYLQPFFMVAMVILLYLPIWLFRWTKLKFAEYFQAAAMSVGPGLFQLPFAMLPSILVIQNYGHPNANDPRVQAVLQSPGSETLAYCAPGFDSLICLNMFGAVAPETAWAGTLHMVIAGVLIIPMARLIKAATGIGYWKQAASLALVSIALGLGFAGVMWRQAY